MIMLFIIGFNNLSIKLAVSMQLLLMLLLLLKLFGSSINR
jgi:hypothetical protein